MSRFFFWLVLLTNLFFFRLTYSATFKDDRGQLVILKSTPTRIVSLLPSLSEMVCALGECARLVGVDRYANFPEFVSKLPKLGGGLDPNIELVISLKPDLVLLASSSPSYQRLKSLGLNVLALEPKTHADVKRTFLILGNVLDVENSNFVWEGIDKGMMRISSKLPQSAKHLRVYFEVSNGPYAASSSSFLGETMTRIGVKNIISGELGMFPKINPEYVVLANPDIILGSSSSLQDIRHRPGWNLMDAVSRNRVCSFNSTQSDILLRPGPRMLEAAQLIFNCVDRYVH